MDDYYYYKRSGGQVPAFGSWDWNSDLPFTQCFESARQAGLLRYSNFSLDHDHGHDYDVDQDRDLYVAGDLYDNHIVTPAMIVVPRRRTKAREQQKEKQSWKVSDEMTLMKKMEGASPISISRPTPKPVDEDLYKISPHLLYSKSKKQKVLGFFSSCLLPPCVL